MSFEVAIAPAPFDIPGVIAQVWSEVGEGVGTVVEIYPEPDGNHTVHIWPGGPGDAWVLPLEPLLAAIEQAVFRLDNYDGGRFAHPR